MTKTIVFVAAAVAASVLWSNSNGHVGEPSATSHGFGAPRSLRVQAATGAAIAGQWTPAASGFPVASWLVRVILAGGGPAVATVEVWSPSVVVSGLAIGGQYRLVVAPSGAPAATATSAPVVVRADQPPDPPGAVTLAPLAGTNGLRATWSPNPAGLAASGAVVQLYSRQTYRGYVTCQAGCTTAAFRGLAYTVPYTVAVIPTNGAGQGAAARSNPVTLRSPCPNADCVSIDAKMPVGVAEHRAQGFLDSMYPVGNMVSLVRDLAPRSWRGSPTYVSATNTFDWSSWDSAVATGAQTTMLLSNLWKGETSNGTGARTPWSNWTSYGNWVTDTVRTIEASGHKVDFWEIQNEPGAPGYYSVADWDASTVADFLQQFQVAYAAIKSVDPNAQIIGPSLSDFADYPGEYNAQQPDLVTFLNFAASHGLVLAAVTWHEINDTLGPNPRDYNSLPESIEDHVAEARQLIAERPALGNPQVWINEYGRPSDYEVPGWTLGDLAALEAASVDRAGRTCWPEQVTGSPAYDDCAAPTLDGLLDTNGSTTRADYWVYATYARMTGQIVATQSSDATIAVLATVDRSAGRIVAMIGRDVGCLPGVNPSCTGTDAVAVPPVPVRIGVDVPWSISSANVTIALVPATWGPVLSPPTVFHGPVRVVDGLLVLSLPGLADGQVYLVTIARS